MSDFIICKRKVKRRFGAKFTCNHRYPVYMKECPKCEYNILSTLDTSRKIEAGIEPYDKK